MKNSYEILGIDRNVTDEEVKKAYKRLAKKYHPDNFATASENKKKQAEEKMKEINTAYDSTKKKEVTLNHRPLKISLSRLTSLILFSVATVKNNLPTIQFVVLIFVTILRLNLKKPLLAKRLQ